MLTARLITATNFTPCPEGLHMARCVQIIDLGIQIEIFKDEKKKVHKIRLGWETPEQYYESEGVKKPFLISKEFTLSLNEKANLRKFLESWRGKQFTEEELKSFDIEKLMSKSCLIQILHKMSKTGNKYADITAITPLMKGMTCSDQKNKSLIFSFENYDENILKTLPKYLQDKIMLSDEYRMKVSPENIETEEEQVNYDDLPF